jgi:hypothetical protein
VVVAAVLVIALTALPSVLPQTRPVPAANVPAAAPAAVVE